MELSVRRNPVFRRLVPVDICRGFLHALGNARALYLSRLAPSPQELNSSLAMGVSINHVASMLIPTVAGAIWVGLGYERLFLGAAAFALVLAGVASLVPRSGRRFTAK